MRVGLVGCGRWGANIARDLRALGARLEVADPLTGAYASARELPPCDAYVVAAPTTSHVDVIAELLPAGKPVFCEKPLAANAASLDALPDAARELVFVMDKWRYHPAIEELGRLAATGALGAVYGVTTRRLDVRHGHADVDCTWILLPHELSIAAEVLGGAPAALAATASFDGGELVALASHLRAAGAYALSSISTRWPVRARTVEVAFADAVATFDDADETLITVMRAGSLTADTIRVPFVPPLRRELEAFLAFATGGPPPKATFADGVESVRTIERLRQLAGIS